MGSFLGKQAKESLAQLLRDDAGTILLALKAAAQLPSSAQPDLIARLRSYAAKFGEIDPERAMCLEAVEALEEGCEVVPKRLLDERDDFIVRKGLWQEFTDSLPYDS